MKKNNPVVPNHISDILSLFHDMVFKNSDGEETFDQYLTLEQKECISLSLAVYYQCQKCIEYHAKVLSKLKNTKIETLNKHVASMVLFLRTDITRISKPEYKRWLETWEQLSLKIALKYKDNSIPLLVGLGIGIARNDDAFIDLFANKLKTDYMGNFDCMLGELISVVIFMKAATSQNRIMSKIEKLREDKNET